MCGVKFFSRQMVDERLYWRVRGQGRGEFHRKGARTQRAAMK